MANHELKHIKIDENTTLSELQLHLCKAGIEYVSASCTVNGTKVGLQLPDSHRFILGHGPTLAEALRNAFEKYTKIVSEQLAKLS